MKGVFLSKGFKTFIAINQGGRSYRLTDLYRLETGQFPSSVTLAKNSEYLVPIEFLRRIP